MTALSFRDLPGFVPTHTHRAIMTRTTLRANGTRYLAASIEDVPCQDMTCQGSTAPDE